MADPIVVKVSALNELTAAELATGDLITIVDISEVISSNKTKKLQAGSLKIFTSSQIADSTVIASKLATDSVETLKIKNENVTTAKIANAAVTSAKLRNSAALSVIGNSTNAAAVPADLTAVSDGQVLRRSGTTLGFGQIVAAGIADNAITEAKLGMIKRTVMIRVTGPADPVETQNYGNFFPWPVTLNGFNVVDARINLAAASGVTGVTVVLSNQGGTMTTLTLAPGKTGMDSSGTIDTNRDQAITNNFLQVSVTSTNLANKGLTITLVLEGNPT